MESSREFALGLCEEVSLALSGKKEVVEVAVATLLARGHLLVQDVPGVGKTTLAKALAKASGVSFSRVQCTSDLLPSDIVGASIFNRASSEFEFLKGPVFADFLLADEVNRTTPKTQSALLEAMEERQVSVEGETRNLTPNFFVIATQNPSEYHGTYPLPESQLDRFLMRISIGYPTAQIEREIIRHGHTSDFWVERVKQVGDREMLINAQNEVSTVKLADAAVDYIHRIIVASREDNAVVTGASIRAAIALSRAARAIAFLGARDYVVPEDIYRLAVPVVAHRLRLRTTQATQQEQESVMKTILDRVDIPS